MNTTEQVVSLRARIEPEALSHINQAAVARMREWVMRNMPTTTIKSWVYNGYGTWQPFRDYRPDVDDIYAPHWCVTDEEMTLLLYQLTVEEK